MKYWEIINQFDGLRMLFKKQSKIFSEFHPSLKENIKKTDLVYLAKLNRNKLTSEKYNLKKLILNNDLIFQKIFCFI